MTLSELIDAAIEAHEAFGDIQVMVLDEKARTYVADLDVAVAQLELAKDHKRVVFAFTGAEPLAEPHATMQ